MTRFVQPEKIEIDANERAVNEKSPYCFFVCTTFDSFLNDFLNSPNKKLFISFAIIYSAIESTGLHIQLTYQEIPAVYLNHYTFRDLIFGNSI